MKRLSFAFAIAGLAICASAHADVWGRVNARPVAIPNTLVTRQSDKGEPVQGPAHVQSPAHVQAPMAVQHDGYPFVSRCGTNDNDCCNGVWDGYAQSCRGWFHGRGCNPCGGLFAGKMSGFGGCGSRCGGCGVTACGNSFGGFGGCGSFAGFGGFSGWSFGSGRGCGGCGHSAFSGCRSCGLGHGIHRLGGSRRCGCSSGCTSGCTSCASSGMATGGCSGCAGHAHGDMKHHGAVQAHGSPIQSHDGPVQKGEPALAHPPVPETESVPAEGLKVLDGEKSARRSTDRYHVVYPMTGY